MPRYQLDQIPSYKQTLLDAIVAISTSDAPVLGDICNLQEVYYLLDALELRKGRELPEPEAFRLKAG